MRRSIERADGATHESDECECFFHLHKNNKTLCGVYVSLGITVRFGVKLVCAYHWTWSTVANTNHNELSK